MKEKLLLTISLLSFGMYAQSFPNPYCNVDVYYDIEMITEVSLNNTTIVNTNDSDPLVDKTSSIVDLQKGNQYTITLKGDTRGNYLNKFIMYIDWNQNGVLNDAGEDYIVGSIENSNGTDNISTSLTFTVPQSAIVGQTRIRINKGYEDEFWFEMTNSPCEITVNDDIDDESYGQMLDFTLNITEPTASLPSLDLTQLHVYPNPAKDVLNINYKEKITKVTIFDINGREVEVYGLNTANNTISVGTLSSGIYLLKVETDTSKTSVIKFVKK